jgi:hypothetical protein
MNKILALALALLPTSAMAASFELTGYVGKALPRYSQTFHYDPGDRSVSVPGFSIHEQGTFTLDAEGGVVVSGAATFYFAEAVGIEGRIDTADASATLKGARYDVTVQPPAGFPPFSGGFTLDTGVAQLDRLKPLSLNLKLRTPEGAVRFAISGGVSYLPELKATVVQPLALGISSIDVSKVAVDAVLVTLSAQGVPDQEGSGGKLGGNLGAGLQISMGHHLSLLVEGRGFLFKKHHLSWVAVPDRVLTPHQEDVLRSVLNRLNPLEFNPTYIQATAGLAFRF